MGLAITLLTPLLSIFWLKVPGAGHTGRSNQASSWPERADILAQETDRQAIKSETISEGRAPKTMGQGEGIP